MHSANGISMSCSEVWEVKLVSMQWYGPDGAWPEGGEVAWQGDAGPYDLVAQYVAALEAGFQDSESCSLKAVCLLLLRHCSALSAGGLYSNWFNNFYCIKVF